MAKYMFGDLVREVKEKIDRNNNPYDYFIAGDHMDTDELHLLRRGTFQGSDVGPAFIRVFKPGQVLYGSRRTYLKKVAVADFEGITANTTFVLESKDESILLQSLLPFIMQSERFVQYSIKRSKGSTNPYVLFSDLADYEVDLPDIERQKELADLLWAIDDVKMAYKKLISATDELVKSQFMEQFVIGTPYPRKALKSYITQVRGVSYKPADLRPSLTEESVLLLRANNIGEGRLNHNEVQYVSAEKVSKVQLIKKDDILMCGSSGSLEHVGKAAICSESVEGETFGAFCKLIRATGDLHPEYIAAYFGTNEYRKIIMQLACGSNINNLKNEHIDDLQIPIPDDDAQQQFIAFVRQSDKSKFELEQALSELTSTYKQIITENLG